MIAVAKKGKGTPKNSTTQSSHLVLTNPKNPNLMLNKNDTNSMPHTPNKSSKQGTLSWPAISSKCDTKNVSNNNRHTKLN